MIFSGESNFRGGGTARLIRHNWTQRKPSHIRTALAIATCIKMPMSRRRHMFPSPSSQSPGTPSPSSPQIPKPATKRKWPRNLFILRKVWHPNPLFLQVEPIKKNDVFQSITKKIHRIDAIIRPLQNP